MLNYQMAKLVDRPRRTRAILPPVQVRLTAEKQYYAALSTMLKQIAAEVRNDIIPLYQAEKSAKAFQADVDRTWFTRLRAMISQVTGTASQIVARVLSLEAQWNTASFMAIAKRALGIDLSAVVRDEDLTNYLTTAVDRNTSLIANLGDDIRQRIERTVYDNSVAGNSVTTLKKQLVEQFGFVDRRAKLIARDQTSKFNSDLNRIRQTQAGVASYSWMTSHDERVRPLHRSLDGKDYKWGEPTGAEDGLPPGQPVLCRCVACGIVQF